MKKKFEKHERAEEALIASLNRNLDLLEEYIRKVSVDRDNRYLGEVAGKLRVLVYRSKGNRPLLLDLMRKKGYTHVFVFDKPWGKVSCEIEEYLDAHGCAVQTIRSGLVSLTNREIIGLFANQVGAAHEDWKLDERLIAATSLPIYVGGVQVHERKLLVIAKNVLSAGRKFTLSLNPKGE